VEEIQEEMVVEEEEGRTAEKLETKNGILNQTQIMPNTPS